MISLPLAQQLKKAGLVWKTSYNDFFGLPDRGMDERVFVLCDMQAQMDLYRGWPVVTFHGASEWALDYILSSEAVWLPTEAQLRAAIFEFLPDDGQTAVQLTHTHHQTIVKLTIQDEIHQYEGRDGAEAYAQLLLHLLESVETT